MRLTPKRRCCENSVSSTADSHTAAAMFVVPALGKTAVATSTRWHHTFLSAISLLAFFLPGCGKAPSNSQKSSTQTVTNVEPATVASIDNQHEGYVGSDQCSECHAEIASDYSRHSMGRSARLLDASIPMPALGKANFVADGYRYTVRQETGNWIHRQTKIAADGSEVAPVEFVARHQIGSGNHGQSYVVEADSHLLMSPITWYPDKQIWDLSPGYEKNNSQFNRPVFEACLYCHTDLTNAVPNTLNAYHSPAIKSHAIGCERCHGPGKQHIEFHKQTAGVPTDTNDSIVNPAKLDPYLREAVCQQCHLSGAARVTKRGRSLYDFRPGQPLESAYTIFTLNESNEANADREFVGHVEQMHVSRCFVASNGELGCTSCHDPHRLPEPDERLTYYRNRCLDCHSTQPCSETMANRDANEDNCIDCHMPARPTEIRHAAVTDHTVPRLIAATAGESNVGPSIVEAFPSNALAKPTPRDKAIALVRIGTKDPDLFSTSQLNVAQEALEIATTQSPDDIEALEALAELYLAGNEFDKAMRVCQQVLKIEPNREQTLAIVGDTYSGTGNHNFATSFWRRALTVNPWMSKYWYKLGEAYAESGLWKQCQRLATDGKARFPTSIGLRHLLLRSHLALNNLKQAAAEYRELEQMQPPGFQKIRAWYRSQAKATPQ